LKINKKIENNHALVNQKSIENEKQIHDTTNQRDIYVNEISHRLTALKKEKEKPKETSLQKDQKPDFPQGLAIFFLSINFFLIVNLISFFFLFSFLKKTQRYYFLNFENTLSFIKSTY